MSTARTPSHTIQSIAKEAKEVTPEYVIPIIPYELVAPMIRNQSDVDEESKEDETNERFYIDETDMIERRFLKDATEKFESDRDIDLFAGSDLFESLLDCALAHPVLKSTMSSLATTRFLSGGNGGSGDDGMLTLAPQLRDETAFESGRIRYQRENPTENLQDAVSILADTSQDMYTRVRALGFLTGKSVVIEDSTGNARIVGPSPCNASADVYWIRGVVDGWLGVTMCAGDAEKRFKDASITRYNPDPDQNGTRLLCNKKVKVATLRDAYEFVYGEKPKKLKKTELIHHISKKCLWGIHIPSIIAAIETN
jgi:hypothetical protein